MGIEFNQIEIDRAHYIGKKTRRKIKFDQLLLNLDHGNQEQPFTKPDQEAI